MPNKKYGVIIVDRSEAKLGFLIGERAVITRRIQSLVPARTVKKMSGSERRFERLIEIAIHEWFETVSAVAEKLFRDANLDAILISGTNHCKECENAAERFVTRYF